MNGKKILAINPGSTSTKIAFYEDATEVVKVSLDHSSEELSKYSNVSSQYEFRKNAVLNCLKQNGIAVSILDAIAARGGPLPPIKGGAYRVNAAMVDRLKNRPLAEHASNLAGIIAFEISESQGIPAYIYDAISADEFSDIARISGMPDIPRTSLCHVLNMRAVSRKVAENLGKPYESVNIICAHLGGGITISIHEKGKMVDIVSDDEGPFSPERAGRVPCRPLIDLCFSGKFDHGTMKRKLRGLGGLVAYTNTNDATEVENRALTGDPEARLIYEAMAYQVAKGIGELATVVKGNVEAIVLTGGIAHSKSFTDWISERVKFIAPVTIVPGENELESLALGVLRVLQGTEVAHEYALD